MEDIKENKYVRTYLGEIGRVIAIKENPDRVVIDDCGQIVLIADITKHSFNLIDLLEVGDIVFIEDVLNNDFIYIYDDEMLKAVKENIEMGLEITEVLTHEQFEANVYKVKGE